MKIFFMLLLKKQNGVFFWFARDLQQLLEYQNKTNIS